MFATDRDIAQVEPNVFRDFVWLGQLISRGTASVNQTLLEASAQDTSFVNNSIELGSVVTINGVNLEIVEALSSSMLLVARLRESIDVPVRPTIDIASSPFHIMTFRPQLEWVHRQVLAMLGLAPAGTGDPVRTSETRVTNPWDFVRVEVYGTLHHIYAAAGSALQFDHPLNQRAAMYRQMFRDERFRIVAQIDLDGDGQPDVLRRMNVGQLVRL